MFDEWLCRLGDHGAKLQAVVEGLPARVIADVKDVLVGLDPERVAAEMLLQHLAPVSIDVGVFRPLADLQCHGHGRGELALPFIFSGTHLNQSSDPIDLEGSIGRWHVKGSRPDRAIRAGTVCLFSESPFWDVLRRAGIPAVELNNWSLKKVYGVLDKLIDAGIVSSLGELQGLLNVETQRLAVDPADGVVFYHDGTYTFVKRDGIGFGGVTQGRFKVTGSLDKLISRDWCRDRSCLTVGCGRHFLLRSGESFTRCEEHRRKKHETGIDSGGNEALTQGSLGIDREGITGE